MSLSPISVALINIQHHHPSSTFFHTRLIHQKRPVPSLHHWLFYQPPSYFNKTSTHCPSLLIFSSYSTFVLSPSRKVHHHDPKDLPSRPRRSSRGLRRCCRRCYAAKTRKRRHDGSLSLLEPGLQPRLRRLRLRAAGEPDDCGRVWGAAMLYAYYLPPSLLFHQLGLTALDPLPDDLRVGNPQGVSSARSYSKWNCTLYA